MGDTTPANTTVIVMQKRCIIYISKKIINLTFFCIFFFASPIIAVANSTDSVSQQIRIAATNVQIPPTLLAAIIQNESRFNPNAISSTGCVGLGQLCRTSAQRPNIQVQCQQNPTAGPQQCSPNCTSTSAYNWCNSCANSDSNCQIDDRFIVSKNILESARVVASKVRSIQNSGCNLTTEAGIKVAAYAYKMEAERITTAIQRVGHCNDYSAIWEQARTDFTPKNCTNNTECGGQATCGTHPAFTNNICLQSGVPLGQIYSTGYITLDKLEEKNDRDPNSYVSKIYADFIRFGGNSPNATFDAISLIHSDPTEPSGTENIQIGFPRPAIKIPGLSFTSRNREGLIYLEPDGGRSLIIPFLGEYIAAIYRYSIGVAMIFSAIIIVVSGIQILISGIHTDGLAQAKKRILASVIAFVLLSSSYTLLFTINPELIRFRSLKIQFITGTSVLNEQVVEGEPPITQRTPMSIAQGSSPTIIPPDGIPYGYNNVPWYFQYDSRWNRIRYGNGSGCTSIGEAGCGPASIAMILKFYGKDVNPTHIATIAVQHGARRCNSGTSLRREFLDAVASQYDMIHLTISRTDAIHVLGEGIPVFAGGAHRGYTSTGGTKTYGGHYIVFTGIEQRPNQQTGQNTPYVRVNDPGNRPHKGITHMTQDMFLSQRRDVTVFVPNTNIPPIIQQLLP
jgi:hypothetical protein